MLDTVSLFDVLADESTEHRIASRRALALAHNRVERNLGRFLRAARDEAEFFERLALVQDDFSGYVATAASEVGHDHPEHIAAALRDHYRLGAGVKFEKTPAEEEDEEDEGKPAGQPPKTAEASTAPVSTTGAHGWVLQAGKQGRPLDSYHPDEDPGDNYPLPGDPRHFPHGDPNVPGNCPECGSPQVSYDNDPNGECLDCGFRGREPGYSQHELAPYGPEWEREQQERGHRGAQNLDQSRTAIAIDDMPMMQQPQPQPQQSSQPQPGTPEWDQWIQQQRAQMNNLMTVPQGAQINYDNNRQMPPGWKGPDSGSPDYLQNRQGGAQNPADQDDDSSRLVTCPQCGGDGKTANKSKCSKCDGKGKVPNFGDSMLDALSKTAEDGNTGLDGPEPKMDKSKGTPGKPEVGEGRWPVKEKDVVEPIKATNEGELSEIGDIKSESLPSEKENAGFQSGGEEHGEHTKTFPKGDQANPVTHETTSGTNPLSELLVSEWPADNTVHSAFLRAQ